MEEEEEGSQSHITLIIGLVLLTAAMWYYWRDLTWSANQFMVGCAALYITVYIVYTSDISLKYGTGWFIAQGFKTSTCGKLYASVGNYDLFTKGDIDIEPIKAGGSDLIIVPKGSWQKVGNNIFCPLRITEVSNSLIPPDVMDYCKVDKKQFLNHRIFRGWADEQDYMKTIKFFLDTDIKLSPEDKQYLQDWLKRMGDIGFHTIGFLVTEIKESTKQCNQYKELWKTAMKNLEDIVSHRGRTSDKNNGGGLKEWVFGQEKPRPQNYE